MGADSPLDDTTAAARWSLRLFGGFELTELASGRRIGSLGKRERVLLAYLAVSPNTRESRRKLATLLWGDASDETALDNLRTCIWTLRKALQDSDHRIIASEAEHVLLDASAFDIDVREFRRLAAETGCKPLESAVELYRGELLSGIDIDNEEFETWRRAEATQLRESVIEVLNRLAKQLANEGESELAIRACMKLLQLDPLHEPAALQLMRLYAASGRRGAAIQLYRTLAEALKSELDAQPEAETRSVYAEIIRGGEDLAQPSAAPQPAATANPPAIARPLHISVTEPAAPLRFPVLATVAALVVVVMLLFAYRQFPLFRATDTSTSERTAASTQASAVSIAVLPFDNMSGDAGQNFFSDGMTEEITTALAKIPDLRVVGRESAFQFKGGNKDLRTIGKALSATHLIEGSVRKSGNRVRITAQLINAQDGTHVWANEYDRELTDIFAVQEDIARAIATSLRMPLGLKPGEQLVSNRGIDADSYEKYLHARALFQERLGNNLRVVDAAALLEEVVARHPNYAPGWALLAYDYVYTAGNVPSLDSGSVDDARRAIAVILQKSDAAAARALQLDPDLVLDYLAEGLGQSARGKYQAAEDLYLKALALDPYDEDALNSYSYMLAAVGQLKKSVPVRQKLETIEPLVPNYAVGTARVLSLTGHGDEALRLLRQFPNFPGIQREVARIYAAERRTREAADALQGVASGISTLAKQEQVAAELLRAAPKATALPPSLPALGQMSFVYAYIGAGDRVLEFNERNAEVGYSLGASTSLMWDPSYAAARKTERFKALARKQGLVDYWRARGWPDLCHPTAGDDFECS